MTEKLIAAVEEWAEAGDVLVRAEIDELISIIRQHTPAKQLPLDEMITRFVSELRESDKGALINAVGYGDKWVIDGEFDLHAVFEALAIQAIQRPLPDEGKVERVARAIYAVSHEGQIESWDEAKARRERYCDTPSPGTRMALAQAEAAIAAIEPATVDEEAVRQSFEEWALLPPKLSIEKDGDGEYENAQTRWLYRAFEVGFRKGSRP